MVAGALPIRRTTNGDFIDEGAGLGKGFVAVGARLVAAGAQATAQIVDQDGTVLYDLSATSGLWDESTIPVAFVRKATLTITGAGAACTLYLG